MVLALLVVACFLILSDSYLTRRGLVEGGNELNPLRALPVKLLGIDLGLYGVAVAFCAALVYAHVTTTAVQTKLFSFGSLAAIYGFAVLWNLHQLRAKSQ